MNCLGRLSDIHIFFNVTLGIVPFAPSFKIQLLFHLFYGLSVNNCTRRKLTIQFLLNCDWNTTFSNWNVMIGRHISVTIQLTFIADIAAFQSSFSNLLFKKKLDNALTYSEKNCLTSITFYISILSDNYLLRFPTSF